MSSAFTSRAVKGELFYQRRTLVKIAIPNPSGSDDEVCNSRPSQVCSTFGPSLEIYLLILFQFTSAELISIAFVLNCLLSCPAYYEGAFGPGDQIGVLSRNINGIEDNFQFVRDSDADQGGLRHVAISDAIHNAEFAQPQEAVEIRYGHREYSMGVAFTTCPKPDALVAVRVRTDARSTHCWGRSTRSARPLPTRICRASTNDPELRT